MRLYHFTCSDSAPVIAECGELRPKLQPLLGRRLVWLTDLDAPTREQVGLTSRLLACDRMEYRVTVDFDAERWAQYARTFAARYRRHALILNQTTGALPLHWWVSAEPVPVLSVERAR